MLRKFFSWLVHDIEYRSDCVLCLIHIFTHASLGLHRHVYTQACTHSHKRRYSNAICKLGSCKEVSFSDRMEAFGSFEHSGYFSWLV